MIADSKVLKLGAICALYGAMLKLIFCAIRSFVQVSNIENEGCQTSSDGKVK